MNPQNSQDDSAMQAMIIVGLLILLLVVFYLTNKALVHQGLALIATWELSPFSWLSRPEKAIHILNTRELPLDILLAVLKLAGSYFRFLVIPVILLLMLVMWKKEKISQYMYRMTAKKLIEENAKFMPCLRPITKIDLLSEAYDSGDWATAKQPTRWAVDNGLLLLPDNTSVPPYLLFKKDGTCKENSPCLVHPEGKLHKNSLHLDTHHALLYFQEQLGKRFDRASMLPHEKGLLAAFLAFGHGDKKTGQGLLDHMSSTFSGPPWKVDIAKAEDVLKEYFDAEEVLELRFRHGQYLSTLLPAALNFARCKGVLSSSQFIWLKPMDRSLWYALHQCGGDTAWVEAAGPWAHSLYEDVLGMATEEPQCQSAVDGLQYVLELEGWLPPVLTLEAAPTVNPVKPPMSARESLQRAR